LRPSRNPSLEALLEKLGWKYEGRDQRKTERERLAFRRAGEKVRESEKPIQLLVLISLPGAAF